MTFGEWLAENRACRYIRNLWKRWRKPFLILYIYSLILYLPLIVLRLTNDMDGMWDQDDHLAGAAELRIGRWFWPYLDRLRFGISLDPLPALLSLALFVTGVLMLLRLLSPARQQQEEGCTSDTKPPERPLTLTGMLCGALMLTSPAILCQLSYSYMSITFAVSFLLAVLAVRVVAVKEAYGGGKPRLLRFGRILLSSLLIAVMLGCYQASLGVTCVAALGCFMLLLGEETRGESSSEGNSGAPHLQHAFLFVLRMLAALVIGAVLYELLLQAHLNFFHQTMSDYNSADALSLAGMLVNLPSSVRHCYSAFLFFFSGSGYRFSALEGSGWFYLLYLVPLLGGLLYAARLWKMPMGALRVVLFALSVLILPVFANAFFLMATESETAMQMTGGMCIVLPVLLMLWDEIRLPVRAKERTRKGLFWENPRRVLAVLSVVFTAGYAGLLYGAIGQAAIDQYAMYVGRAATTTLARSILNEYERYGIDYNYSVVMVYGSPAQSQTFAVGEQYWKANAYAQYGNWAQTEESNQLCWSHFFEQQMKINMNYAEGDTLHAIYTSPEVEAMTVYPQAGSTANIWGVTVVKIE